MVNIVNQARLFQKYRKLFGWDDESSHYDVQLYGSSFPPTSENVVLFSDTCALRYSGGTVIFVSVHDQDGTVDSAMAKAATSQISVEHNQLVTAALGKPDHPAQQWQRFLYLTTNHLHAPEAMLADQRMAAVAGATRRHYFEWMKTTTSSGVGSNVAGEIIIRIINFK